MLPSSVFVAPSLGLHPELPGTAAAELVVRLGDEERYDEALAALRAAAAQPAMP